jgi:hypothetical protein
LHIEKLVKQQREKYSPSPKGESLKLPKIKGKLASNSESMEKERKKQSPQRPKTKPKSASKLKIKASSLTSIMLNPKMKKLRQTWMGSYYLKQIKIQQLRLKNKKIPEREKQKDGSPQETAR